MKKEKTVYVCQECGYTSVKWLGRCPSCGSWNSMVEEKGETYLKVVAKRATPKLIHECTEKEFARFSTGFKNLDQALGGGIIQGQVLLLAGEPGIGKSTLLSQISAFLSFTYGSVLYVSGEESEYQVSLRVKRLGLETSRFYITTETNLESLLELIRQESYSFLVVDSIQTLYSSGLESSPGSVAQLRECTFGLVQACKELGIPLFLVGQINKEGMVAGPKVLEHIVDTVLYFEGERFSFHRVVKVVKNRFGASSSVAVFRMTSRGLEEVAEPSAFFLQERVIMPGSVVFPYMEGGRPVLVEVQALTIPALYTTPQRRTQGFDVNRLSLILAVLEKSAKIFTRDRDVFVNIVGGIRVEEPAIDLAVALAVASSVKEKSLGDLLVFGELGLGGEVRAVHFAEERLREGARFGFKKAIVPKGSYIPIEGMEVSPIHHIKEAVDYII